MDKLGQRVIPSCTFHVHSDGKTGDKGLGEHPSPQVLRLLRDQLRTGLCRAAAVAGLGAGVWARRAWSEGQKEETLEVCLVGGEAAGGVFWRVLECVGCWV